MGCCFAADPRAWVGQDGIHSTFYERINMPRKFKSIRICADNSAAIATAVAAIVGSTAGTRVLLNSVQRAAIDAEKALEQLDLPLRDRVGATFLTASGKPTLEGSDKSLTFLTLRRRTAGWHLEEVLQTSAVHPERAGLARLVLTPGQDACATARLARKYHVESPLPAAVASPLLSPAPKAIRICPAMQDAIRSALRAVNGRATAHAFSTYSEIAHLAQAAEKALQQLQLAPRDRVGAAYTCVSGASVANAYKYARTGTRVTLRRRTGGWYLAEIESAMIYAQGGALPRLTLTSQQHAKAVELRRGSYVVRRPDQLAAETAQAEALAVLSEIRSASDESHFVAEAQPA